MALNRRRMLQAAIASTTWIAPAAVPLAIAQSSAGLAGFPAKPVRIIVPFTAGGLTDTLARGIGQELTRVWGQPVVVENKPGANTIIAAQAAAAAAPDGYTLLMANDPTLSSNQYLYAKLPYDPVKDFTTVINLAETIELLVAGPAFKGSNLRDVIDNAKARPGELTYGTYGIGSKAHIDAEAFAKATGVKLLHVPYKGVADVVPALLGGQIQIAFIGVPPALPQLQGGLLRAIALAAPRRTMALPDVPTFTEAGLPGFHSSAWFGLVAPAATPQPIVDKIAADVSRVIVQPEFQKKFITGVGLELLNQNPAAFARFLKEDRAAYAVHIKSLNVKFD